MLQANQNSNVNNVELTQLTVYPVKSLRGIDLEQAKLTRKGLAFDRNWMVVDSDGDFVTQRQIPKMATIEVRIDAEALILSMEGKQDLSVPITLDHEKEPPVFVVIHGKGELGIPEGDAAGKWLTEALGTYKGKALSLVRFPSFHKRVVDPEYLGRREEHTAFADEYPLLVTSEESLAELNCRLEENGSQPVPMSRFRPNLVIAGAPAFAEDDFSALSIGSDVHLVLVKPSARCSVTTVDQESGTQPEPKEPLRTLKEFRKRNGKVLFGENAIVVKGDGKVLSVGDTLRTR